MTIRVKVDVANPGQFFACCGLLELADRLWPGAEGAFDEQGFLVECDGDLRTVLSILVMDSPIELPRLPGSEIDVRPIVAPLELTFDGGASAAMILDSWVRIGIAKGVPMAMGNVPWNMWSGQQTSLRIWSGLREVLATQLKTVSAIATDDVLSVRVVQSGRFGFDPGPSWNALDVGFSPNEQGMEVESSAATELLAAVGLQRFRPQVARNRESFEYSTWGVPLGPLTASAAMAGTCLARQSRRFRAAIISRGQYAACSRGFPLAGGSNNVGHEAI